MKLRKVSEVVLRFYDEGRVKATGMTFTAKMISEYVKIAYNNYMRQLYKEGKKMGESPDYYFYSPILAVKRFELSKKEDRGSREANISGENFFVLPENSHFVNVYPHGDGCNDSTDIEITQVSPGEENFYKADSGFCFFVQKGNKINVYHLPPCVNHIDIESTFDVGEDTEIAMDIAFDVAASLLGIATKLGSRPIKVVDNPFNPNATELRRRLEETQQ